MPFDFDEQYQDVEPVGTALSRREGLVFAAVAHAVVVAVFLLTPQLLWVWQAPAVATASPSSGQPVPSSLRSMAGLGASSILPPIGFTLARPQTGA